MSQIFNVKGYHDFQRLSASDKLAFQEQQRNLIAERGDTHEWVEAMSPIDGKIPLESADFETGAIVTGLSRDNYIVRDSKTVEAPPAALTTGFVRTVESKHPITKKKSKSDVLVSKMTNLGDDYYIIRQTGKGIEVGLLTVNETAGCWTLPSHFSQIAYFDLGGFKMSEFEDWRTGLPVLFRNQAGWKWAVNDTAKKFQAWAVNGLSIRDFDPRG